MMCEFPPAVNLEASFSRLKYAGKKGLPKALGTCRMHPAS